MIQMQMTVRFNNAGASAARIKTVTDRNLVTLRRFGRDRAKDYARVDTGEMKENIRETADGFGGFAPHTVHNEFGTYKMSAQPMLRPAAVDTANEVSNVFRHFEVEIAGP